MKVASFEGFSGPSDVTIQEVPDPEPAPNEVVLGIEAASVNRHDLRILEGGSNWVTESDLPYVSGADIVGIVRQIGSEVDRVDVGERVLHCPNRTCNSCQYCFDGPENRCEAFSLFHGGFAESAAVPAKRLLRLPENISSEAAAALPIAYMTAWHMLRRAEPSPDDLVFIPGATGDVGIAAIQLVDAIGGRSIGTTTSPQKADKLRDIGTTHVIKAETPEGMQEKVSKIGEPDVTVNHLGGEYVNVGLKALRQGGRMAICGRTTGDWSEIHTKHLYRTHKQILGSAAGTQPDLQKIVGLVSNGEVSPIIGQTYELEDTANAFQDMKDDNVFGSQIIFPNN
jgi:NADPH2:quinone reductase